MKLIHSVISAIVGFGLRFILSTVRMKTQNIEYLKGGKAAGFWHGDSIAALILLKQLKDSGVKFSIVVTADWRGDVIEKTIRRYGHRTVRVKDGLAARHAMAELKAESMDMGYVLAMALDGPLGPVHKPKKILFHLAMGSGREMTAISFKYGRAVRLNRWDSYAIPLPFSEVGVTVHKIGYVTRELLSGFDAAADSIPK
ncbi:MAG: hypothetical protein LBL09_00065 [Oscillospiraceae bacterium]|nr:hypothetical protein [Oscillospiraceae bacterium]